MPDMWQAVDNIFPEFLNSDTCTIDLFSNKIKDFIDGDIIEFGVASCQSTINIARSNPNRKLFAIDHFKGLEKSNKTLPPHAGWDEGAFRVGDPNCPWIPSTIEDVKNKLKPYSNINLIVEDVHNLKHPSYYNINKIAAVHIDVDIYEPTVSCLNFLDLCEWHKIYIRFDDWHGHDPQFDSHERLACKEWLDKNKYFYEIPQNGHAGGVLVWK